MHVEKFSLNIFTCLLVVVVSITMKVHAKQIVMAHRGASGYLPELSNEAIVAAFMMGVDFIEQDVVLTKDDQPLIMHDLYLDGVTDVARRYPGRNRSDSHYYAIDFTLDEVRQLRVTERVQPVSSNTPTYPDRFPIWTSRFGLTTLEEKIQLIQGLETSFKNIYALDVSGELTPGLPTRRAGLYIELKSPAFHRREGKPYLSEIVLAALTKYGYRNRTDPAIIQCFDPVEIRRIRNDLGSDLRLNVLMPVQTDPDPSSELDWNSPQGVQEIATFANGIGPAFPLLIDNQAFLETGVIQPTDLYHEAKRQELFIHAYTFRIDQLPPGVQDYDTLMHIFYDDLKVDGVFTDFPDLSIQYLTRENAATSTHHKQSSTMLGLTVFATMFVAIYI